MKFITRIFAAVVATVAMGSAALAQQQAASVGAPAGYAPLQAPCVSQSSGVCNVVSASNPMPVTLPSGLPIATTTTQLPSTPGPKTSVSSLSITPASDASFAITAMALPLPGGAATETTLVAVNTKLAGTLKVDTVIAASATDRGASITTAGTAQQLMASNSARRGLAVQNQSAGACYINGTGTATQDYHSLKIDAGSYYETPPGHTGTGAVSIICAVSSAAVYAREW